MSKTLQLLGELLPKLDSYQALETEITIEGFVRYLTNELNREQKQVNGDSTAISTMRGHKNVNAQIAFHVNRLNKYAKYYIKDALKNTPLSKGEDFAFLASIIQFGSINKTNLIAYNVAEVPTGMDIIKRLVKNGLVTERVDKEDRRIKLLEATPSGNAAFFAAMQQMEKVGRIVVGKLNENQKDELLELLEKLDHFHERIYTESKEYNVDIISETYL